MKIYLRNQKGSAMVLALLTMVFLTITLSGLMPFVNSQVLHSSLNADAVEAQYAAEAGAKRAIVGLMKNRIDWAWADGITQQSFNDLYSTTEKNYVVKIDPPITSGVAPTSGVTYIITSVGSIGKAHKSVVLRVRAGSGDTLFKYGIYSANNMSLWSGTINGDVATNSAITMGLTINGNVYANGDLTNNSGYISGTATYGTTITNRGTIAGGAPIRKTTAFTTLDISSLMKYAPTIPTFPPPAGYTAISSGSALTAGTYYCNGNYANWSGNNFNIASGQSLVLYVNGNFTGNFNITGGGNVKIYANNGISLWGSNSFTGDIVEFYSGGELSLGSSTRTTGKLITLQSTGVMNLYGSVNQSAASGIVNVYSGGTLYLQGQTTASLVTMIALASNFNGGIINPSLSGAVSKLYIVGDVALNSNIAIGSYGTAMIISLGTISLNGASLSTTSLLATGNVNVYSGSCGGVYSNGTFIMSGGTVTYDPSASAVLGLNSGAPFSIISWSNKL